MVTLDSIESARSMVCMLLEDGRKVWLRRADFYESGWKAGDSIDEEAFEKFIQIHQYPKALDQAVAMLARRPCSKGEIRQNLRRHRYEDEVIDLALYKLEKEKLLDDHEFSEQWVQYRGKKLGTRRIIQELRHKGVAEETIQQALEEISEDEQYAVALSHAQKAWSRVRPDENRMKARQKIINSLVRKGFDWEIARKASDLAENME